MKKLTLDYVFNMRKPFSHMAILILTVIITLWVGVAGNHGGLKTFSLILFAMLFIQIEVFIFLGGLLFAELNFDRSPGEITRIVLVRFMVFIAGCMVVSIILFVSVQYITLFIAGGNTTKIIFDFVHTGFREWFRSTISGLSFGALIFIVLLWQSSLKREQKLREEKLIFQNETLKNQVNPHFLFNSLNTLSSLIVTNPDVAERFIIRLSSIYRYILENSQKDKVPLENELEFINDYFDLHRVRDKEKILLNIHTPNASDYEICPVSLQILMENAIKHNMATRDNPLTISVYLEDEYIVVRNNLQRMAARLSSTKIGLKNLAERVSLISKKELIIEETNDFYTVKVPLLR